MNVFYADEPVQARREATGGETRGRLCICGDAFRPIRSARKGVTSPSKRVYLPFDNATGLIWLDPTIHAIGAQVESWETGKYLCFLPCFARDKVGFHSDVRFMKLL